ncbi:hypothetical protein DIE07_10390 [Burkholderia sp. Bp9002]|nr:hypothetical protein DIE07_10390 [Burkholderia sp. Bp9002]
MDHRAPKAVILPESLFPDCVRTTGAPGARASADHECIGLGGALRSFPHAGLRDVEHAPTYDRSGPQLFVPKASS